jgi:hypothetical protein
VALLTLNFFDKSSSGPSSSISIGEAVSNSTQDVFWHEQRRREAIRLDLKPLGTGS